MMQVKHSENRDVPARFCREKYESDNNNGP